MKNIHIKISEHPYAADVPEVQVNTTLNTLSSKTKVNKTLVSKLDVILQ